jgi:hypothetical protein
MGPCAPSITKYIIERMGPLFRAKYNMNGPICSECNKIYHSENGPIILSETQKPNLNGSEHNKYIIGRIGPSILSVNTMGPCALNITEYIIKSMGPFILNIAQYE